MTCDGRLFHRRVAATGNALSPTVDRRVHARRTSRDVDEAERSRRVGHSIAAESQLRVYRATVCAYTVPCYLLLFASYIVLTGRTFRSQTVPVCHAF